MKQNTDNIKLGLVAIAFVLLLWLILRLCTSFTYKSFTTMTYVDRITLTEIPSYRDSDQALRDEDLPIGCLYIIAGEDYVRIKKYQL